MHRLPERPTFSNRFISTVRKDAFLPNMQARSRWTFDLIALAISHGYFPEWRINTKNNLERVA